MEAAEYQRMFEQEERHWWFQGTRRVLDSVLERTLEGRGGAPLTVVDVGCGTGHTTVRLGKWGAAIGVEPDAGALALARNRAGASFLRGHAAALPFGDCSADLLTLLDVIEHLDDDAAALAEARRVLRPGGVLVVTVPAFAFLWSQHDVALHHRRRYRKSRVYKLLEEQSFETKILTYYNSFLFPAVALVRLGSKLLPGRGQRPPTSDLSLPIAPLNALLSGILGAERFLVGRVPLPAGVSVIAVARKPG